MQGAFPRRVFKDRMNSGLGRRGYGREFTSLLNWFPIVSAAGASWRVKSQSPGMGFEGALSRGRKS